MKRFNIGVAKVKNSQNEYETIPAIRGDSTYELAKRNGYTGTEEDYYKLMMDGGWPAAVTELDINKADKETTNQQAETINSIVTAVNSHIVTDSYLGTYEYPSGTVTPITLEFQKTPEMIMIQAETQSVNQAMVRTSPVVLIKGCASVLAPHKTSNYGDHIYSDYVINVTWNTDGSVVLTPNAGASHVINQSGVRFYYLAFIKEVVDNGN